MKEFELIKYLTNENSQNCDLLRMGIGDDCAVIKNRVDDWLVTTDALFEGVHFDLSYTPFYLLGRKSLSVNLSDIAAMGGEPLFYTIALGIPNGVNPENLKKMYDGMNDVASLYNVAMIGGDTCNSQSGLALSITLIGKVPAKKAILRKGALSGDAIYITGTAGEAALGFNCFQKKRTGSDVERFLKRFNDPEPRIKAGKWLMSQNIVTSMIDISDGLSQDLSHIAEDSKVGFKIYADNLPLSQNFCSVARELDIDPLKLVLTGGEDYELLFTVRKNDADRFEALFKKNKDDIGCLITKIGEITSDKDERLIVDKKGNLITFDKTGFEHNI